jgi:hypothetical protein
MFNTRCYVVVLGSCILRTADKGNYTINKQTTRIRYASTNPNHQYQDICDENKHLLSMTSKIKL